MNAITYPSKLRFKALRQTCKIYLLEDQRGHRGLLLSYLRPLVIVPVKSFEELQIMTGESYDVLFQDPEGKPIARKNQKYPEAPPTRLLSMTLNLCYWLGYHDADKGHELHKEKEGGIGALDRIDKPTKAANPKSSSNHVNAKTEKTT